MTIDFFKLSDFPEEISGNPTYRKIVTEYANRILAERGIPVYGSKIKPAEIWALEDDRMPHHSHQSIMLPPWPIAKPEPECNLCRPGAVIRVKEIFKFTISFCPGCGKDLR